MIRPLINRLLINRPPREIEPLDGPPLAFGECCLQGGRGQLPRAAAARQRAKPLPPVSAEAAGQRAKATGGRHGRGGGAGRRDPLHVRRVHPLRRAGGSRPRRAHVRLPAAGVLLDVEGWAAAVDRGGSGWGDDKAEPGAGLEQQRGGQGVARAREVGPALIDDAAHSFSQTPRRSFASGAGTGRGSLLAGRPGETASAPHASFC